tara:strand:- start:873 stop:1730 length:858 start_codon:yes stop_codon:yes gene_type:complete
MATIDLGKIKFVFRGTYANGTAYIPDDVVSFTDGSVTSSYICTTATTGNNPSSGGTLHGSWAFLAKGQAVSPTTTQGDIIVRGASADQRLAIGSAGQALKVNSSANGLEYGLAGGVLQAKQWVKRSSIDNNTQSDSVLASPFDGTARITPSAAGNMIKATYFNTIDHGTNWRSNKLRMDYSIDGGSNYHGIAGCAISSGDGNNTMFGNSACMVVMFNPDTTNEVRVRVITNGHNSGAGRRHGQYNNEGSDTGVSTPDAPSNTIAVGHGILLEEYSSQIASFTAIA